MNKLVSFFRKSLSLISSAVAFFLIFMVFILRYNSTLFSIILVVLLSVPFFLLAYFSFPKKVYENIEQENNLKSKLLFTGLLKFAGGITAVVIGGVIFERALLFPDELAAVNLLRCGLSIVFFGNGFRWYYYGISGKLSKLVTKILPLVFQIPK